MPEFIRSTPEFSGAKQEWDGSTPDLDGGKPEWNGPKQDLDDSTPEWNGEKQELKRAMPELERSPVDGGGGLWGGGRWAAGWGWMVRRRIGLWEVGRRSLLVGQASLGC